MHKVDLKSLMKDSSINPRIPVESIECFNRHFFYFFPNYPNIELLKIQNWDNISYPESLNPEYYYNIDYKMLELKNLSKDYKMYTDYLFFLVTSIDQKGIISPVNLYEKRVFHPGGKRVNIAAYLGIESLPAVVQSTINLGDSHKISSLDDLLGLYNNNCSLIYRTEFDRIEVAWHGITGLRDKRGYDDWFAKAEQSSKKFLEKSLSDVILEQGLEIITDKKQSMEVNKIYKTYFTNHSRCPIRIKILDSSLLDLDLWELYFHIDPSVYKKIDETGTIIIENDYAREEATILENCKMMRTLKRQKFYTRDYIIRK